MKVQPKMDSIFDIYFSNFKRYAFVVSWHDPDQVVYKTSRPALVVKRTVKYYLVIWNCQFKSILTLLSLSKSKHLVGSWPLLILTDGQYLKNDIMDTGQWPFLNTEWKINIIRSSCCLLAEKTNLKIKKVYRRRTTEAAWCLKLIMWPDNHI